MIIKQVSKTQSYFFHKIECGKLALKNMDSLGKGVAKIMLSIDSVVIKAAISLNFL